MCLSTAAAWYSAQVSDLVMLWNPRHFTASKGRTEDLLERSWASNAHSFNRSVEALP